MFCVLSVILKREWNILPVTLKQTQAQHTAFFCFIARPKNFFVALLFYLLPLWVSSTWAPARIYIAFHLWREVENPKFAIHMGGSYFSLSVSQICLQNLFTITHGCAIVETGSRYQYQYFMTLGCNTNINISDKRSGFATSIPISILVQLI